MLQQGPPLRAPHHHPRELLGPDKDVPHSDKKSGLKPAGEGRKGAVQMGEQGWEGAWDSPPLFF